MPVHPNDIGFLYPPDPPERFHETEVEDWTCPECGHFHDKTEAFVEKSGPYQLAYEVVCEKCEHEGTWYEEYEPDEWEVESRYRRRLGLSY